MISSCIDSMILMMMRKIYLKVSTNRSSNTNSKIRNYFLLIKVSSLILINSNELINLHTSIIDIFNLKLY